MNKKELKWVIEKNGCWRCTSHKSWQGYAKMGGQLVEGTYRPISIATVMLMRKTSKPPGLLALHKCGNRWCINPDHLYWGTPEQNIHDAIFHGTMMGWKTFETRKLIAMEEGTVKELSRKYGVSKDTVRNVKNGKYKDLELFAIPIVPARAERKNELGFKLREIGEYLGVSRQRVYQLYLANSPRLKEAIEYLNSCISA